MQEFIHNLDPFLIHISGNFGIRWYGMAYLIGFLLCWLTTYQLAKKGKTTVSMEQAGDFIMYLAFGTMLGGRFGYVLFYRPDLLAELSYFPIFGIKIPMWSALAVWEGGMASHGGIAGLGIACLLFGRKYRINYFHLMDLTCLAGPIAVFFGRLANFINGELYGRACNGGCFWPVKFPDELNRWVSTGQYKEQLTALFPMVEKMGPFNILGEPVTPDYYQWSEWVNKGSVQVGTAISRITQKVSSGDQTFISELGAYLIARHPSQLYQALLEGLFVFLVLGWLWRKPRKPGFIIGCWGILYAITRIIGEQWRMPDAHIGFQWLGLTRGQWLSVGMLCVFVALLIYTQKREAEPMGGWATK